MCNIFCAVISSNIKRILSLSFDGANSSLSFIFVPQEEEESEEEEEEEDEEEEEEVSGAVTHMDT